MKESGEERKKEEEARGQSLGMMVYDDVAVDVVDDDGAPTRIRSTVG